MEMFCYQCEQTARGSGCTVSGVCGKDPVAANLQDLLVYATKGLAMYAHRARLLGAVERDFDVCLIKALFSTVTNVDFDPERLQQLLHETIAMRNRAREVYAAASWKQGHEPEVLTGPAVWTPAEDLEALLLQAEYLCLKGLCKQHGEDVIGLQQLILYGLKGAAAYADHAQILGVEADEVYAAFHTTLDFLAGNPQDTNQLLTRALDVGKLNLQAMELLDRANTTAYGHPVPTPVRTTPLKGKAILVSGHDLKDLEELLKQTEGKGISIYTHGEMLPAHGYPGLKKYQHLAGNFGSAWQEQIKEFGQFPGAILLTTNCLQRPQASYKDRLFTSGLVAWPGIQHVPDRDFSRVIEAALAAEGFTQDGPDKTILVGFGRNAVLSVADKVIDAVKLGQIRHFFLIGGCDGAKPGRNYYTEFAQLVPKDCVILTLACGKYRFNDLEFGDIGGIPRLLDVGQCNDAYSAVKIAEALAGAFNTDFNGLPLSLILSWYEQKAVAILLTLLYLGVKDIRLGPSLPAFVTPAVLGVLVENFNIKPITNAQADLDTILGGAEVAAG